MKSSSSTADRVRQAVTLIAILSTFAANTWTNVAPPNGVTIGDIANTVFRDVLIIPANYAFAIWGLIYVGLIVFGIYQALPGQRQNPRLRRIGYWLAIACVAQIFWVFLFQYQQFTFSIAAMLGILIPLIVSYLGLGDVGSGRSLFARDMRRRPSRLERWAVDIPFSIYLAWISVATIVNVASALYAAEWGGWGIGAVAWTVIMLLVGAGIAAAIAFLRRDLAFVAVIVWAYVAIAIRQAAYSAIVATAVGLAIALAGLIIALKLQRPKSMRRF